MQAVVPKAAPAAGLMSLIAPRRIGGYARDLMRLQDRIGAFAEPASMTRLAGDPNAAAEVSPNICKKCNRAIGVKDEAGRQLHKKHAKIGAQSSNFRGEAIELLFALE